MKKALLIVTAVVVVFGFMGLDCFSKSVDYFPVGEGMKWTFQTAYYDSTYYEMGDSSVVSDSTHDYTSECIGETTLDDGTEVWEFTTDGGTSYMAIGDEYVDFYTDKADTEPAYSMPKDLAVGSTWSMDLTDTTSIDYEVTGTEDVTVPAAAYTGCLKVEITNPEVPNTVMENAQWWDAGEGVVKAWGKTEVTVEGIMFMFSEYTTELQSVE
jgi:hypothetical protein